LACREPRGADARSGNAAPYVFRIALSVPGAHIHADSFHLDVTRHKDIYLALRDAFNNAERPLQDLRRDRSVAAHSR
jgi:hypothetical protein